MITKHTGGEIVKGGIYWSFGGGEFIAVPAEGGSLAGGPQDRYIKAPLPLVLILAPVMGLAFAIFLPLSGLLVLVPFLAGKVRGAVASGKVSAAHMATPRAQPGAAYLESRPSTNHRKPTPDLGGSEEDKGKLIDLAKEIAEKRWQDR